MQEYEAIEDEETSINAPSVKPASAQPQTIYNLQGQKLSQPQKGINIVNGVKRLVDEPSGDIK